MQAEATILGAMLLESLAITDATMRLRADDFSMDSHRKIYKAMLDLQERGTAIDFVTVGEELRTRKELEAVGGPAYLASLTEGLPRNLSVESYVKIVKDKSLLRQLMAVCDMGLTQAADQGQDAVGLLGDVEQKLLEISESALSGGLTNISDIVKDSFGSVDQLYENRKEITGLATHFTEFDTMTSGLQKGELIIIAARPSMGKTAWAINIAQNAAVQGDSVVAVFSLEMGKEALLRRMLASEARVNMQHIQTGFISRTDLGKLTGALGRLTSSKMFVDDTPGITLTEMRAKARRLRQQEKRLDLVVVDYLQLMTASSGGKRYENRTQEVSAISRGLKTLAKELHVPVIALSQLSRGSEQRGGDHKPMLSDLRESGSIEQDADVVAFIHRESYYKRGEDNEEDPDMKGKAEIIISKQRNGPTGSVKLAWQSEFTRFDNLDRTHTDAPTEF